MSGTNDNNDVLYLHITPSGKKYFGVTNQKPERRWRNGYGYKPKKDENGHEKPSRFWNAIQKYGWDNIEHIILADDLTPEEADLFEIFFIAYYDTTNRSKGYNQDRGGRGHNHHPSEETKRKIGEANKGKHTGEKHHLYGKTGKDHYNSKTVICTTTNQVFYGVSEAGRITGVNWKNISNVCTGKRKSAGKLPDGTKLRWAYVKDLPKPQVSEEMKQILSNGPKLLKVA